MESWIFRAAILLVSLLFVFHAGVLLIVPDKYLPTSSWGQSGLTLVRKPPSQFGKRIIGLFGGALILWWFTIPSISSWMLHSQPMALVFWRIAATD